MTVTVKNLFAAKQAENAQTTQYTAVAKTTIIDKHTVTNTTGGGVAYTVNIVPSGSVASASNQVLPAKTIAAGETYHCPEVVGQVLNPGDFISTLAGAAASLTILANGREIT